MRIAFANDGFGDAGGVETYLRTVAAALRRRGVAVALLTHDRPRGEAGLLEDVPAFSAAADVEAALAALAAWQPDLVYSHNMRFLDLERRLLDRYPVVKFMHGYFGTCVSGLKSRGWPSLRPCERRLGLACLALYGPCRCGPLNIGWALRSFDWHRRQAELFPRYSAVVVGSGSMADEYRRHGVPTDRLYVNPLFAPAGPPREPADRSDGRTVLFVGRMTHLKGGDLLVRAAAAAGRSRSVPPRLVMAGDGPQRPTWQRLAVRLGVEATFPGWIEGTELDRLYAAATVLAVPSVWPEPFGLVGLEAARHGVPAIAFDVGGIREWLTDGVNGLLVPGSPPRPDGFAAALSQLLSDPILRDRLQAGARKRATELTAERHVDVMETVFRCSIGPM